jgi:hypothetical protein
MALVLIVCLALPAGLAFAETPTVTSMVVANEATTGLGSPFQHHSFIDDGSAYVFYLDNSSNQIVGKWSTDMETWTSLAAIHACNGSTAETVGGQFDCWWDAGTSTVHFIAVNNSANASDISYGSYTVDSTAHTLTANAPSWVVAVAGEANVSYRNPTICYTQNASVFITYGRVNQSISDVYVLTPASEVANPWVAQTGFPMYNLSAIGNVSMYGSVIPLYTSTDNVSVQYAELNGSEYEIYQLDIEWNGSDWNKDANGIDIDTSAWYCPTGYEWDYDTVSIDTTINDNDVAIVYGQTNGSDYRTIFCRRGSELDIWNASYTKDFGTGAFAYQFIGAMGIRNAISACVFSAFDLEALSTKIWSSDFDATTGNWSTIATVANDASLPYVSTMSDYRWDASGVGALGFLWGDQGDDIWFGYYGTDPDTDTIVDDMGNLTGTVASLVISFLIIMFLLGIAVKEGIQNGNTEAIKVSVAGIIGIVIIETIVIAFF